MSYCRREGKDTIVFASKEDHDKPSSVQLPEPEPERGLIMPDGSINWNCPCLGGMPTGPCGMEFRDAFGCFHYSTADPKGSDCFAVFEDMQNCMSKYPTVYDRGEEDFKMEEEDKDTKNRPIEANETKEMEPSGSGDKTIEKKK